MGNKIESAQQKYGSQQQSTNNTTKSSESTSTQSNNSNSKGSGIGNSTKESVSTASSKKIMDEVDINVKPTVSNRKLQNIVDALYKGQGGQNTIGNGTTMNAVRNELITGEPTNGKFHMQKLSDLVNALNRRLRAGDLNAHDKSVVEAILQEALDALGVK
jgi:hypothetical protein